MKKNAMSSAIRTLALCLSVSTLVFEFSVRSANAEEPLGAEVGKRAQKLINSKQAVGIVVGVIHHDKRQVFGFGQATDNKPQPPDGKTVFEIGSITKTFTALVLAQLVSKGDLKLDDPVASLLPESVTVPQWEGKPITLRNLATHTASLPAIPASLSLRGFTNTSQVMANPYKGYSTEEFHRSLSTFKLKQKPGEKYFYSNQGMGLLADALKDKLNKSYEAMIRERITDPMGMSDTRIAGDDAWTARFAMGHDAGGKPTEPWEMTSMEGAGALRSTMDDMLVYLAAQLRPDSTTMAEALKLSHQRQFTVAPDTLSIGLAWHIDDRNKIIWHNGGTIGFHSYMGFQPDQNIGVVVLANSATFAIDKLGIDILKSFEQQTK